MDKCFCETLMTAVRGGPLKAPLYPASEQGVWLCYHLTVPCHQVRTADIRTTLWGVCWSILITVLHLWMGQHNLFIVSPVQCAVALIHVSYVAWITSPVCWHGQTAQSAGYWSVKRHSFMLGNIINLLLFRFNSVNRRGCLQSLLNLPRSREHRSVTQEWKQI